MYKKRVYGVICALLMMSAGCLGTIGMGDNDEFLIVQKVEQPPSDATVVSVDNETVQRSAALVAAIEEAAQSNETETTRELSRQEAEQVREVLSELPTYTDGQGLGDTYIRAGNTTVTVLIGTEQ